MRNDAFLTLSISTLSGRVTNRSSHFSNDIHDPSIYLHVLHLVLDYSFINDSLNVCVSHLITCMYHIINRVLRLYYTQVSLLVERWTLEAVGII